LLAFAAEGKNNLNPRPAFATKTFKKPEAFLLAPPPAVVTAPLGLGVPLPGSLNRSPGQDRAATVPPFRLASTPFFRGLAGAASAEGPPGRGQDVHCRSATGQEYDKLVMKVIYIKVEAQLGNACIPTASRCRIRRCFA
jgi:hypothetical protein